MSIETLLEAAMFLELQAQQQKTREEHEKRDKQLLEREPERRKTDLERVNNVLHIEEVKAELHAVPVLPIPKPLPPPAAAATAIIVPHVVSPSLALSPLPPQIVQRHQPILSPANSTREISQSPPVLHRSPISTLTDPQPGLPLMSSSPQQFTSSVLAIPPHHVIQQSPLPQQPSGLKPSPVDDGKPQDQKRRPGGAGTREVHNKLEKNRRAHLKECFETLKKNIPNLDDKKTSNLSVLRSALRYIQGNLSWPIHLTCTSLDCGKKPEHPEETHADTGRTYRLRSHPKLEIERGTLAL